MQKVFGSKVLLTVVAACIGLLPCATGVSYSREPVPGPENTVGKASLDLLAGKGEGAFSKHGWNHFGEGYFTLDKETGVLTAHSGEGSGLLWYSARQFQDFVLELDYRTGDLETNSGIFLRIPEPVTGHDYIGNSFEVQIFDNDRAGMTHYTGAIYDANPPSKTASRRPGEWNHFRITCQGRQITVELNGEVVNDWMAEPRGKVKTHWPKGYIGLQNYYGPSVIEFRNIRVREL